MIVFIIGFASAVLGICGAFLLLGLIGWLLYQRRLDAKFRPVPIRRLRR